MDTILVVEDDHTVQKTMKRLFESEGYRVQICGDGESALDKFRATAPTAVILDLGLPLISGKMYVGRSGEKRGHYQSL